MSFTDDYSRELNYGTFKIAIPPEHRAGHIEWPTLTPAPAVSFTTAQQEVIDKRTFQQCPVAVPGLPQPNAVGSDLPGLAREMIRLWQS